MIAVAFVLGVGCGVLLGIARSHRDALTGLPQRGAIPRWLFWHRGMVTAVIADLNGLKHINDTLGHAAGDAAISTLAHCVRSVVRPGDLVVRLGGDELLVLAQTADPATVADRIRRACRDAGVAVAIGAAVGPGRRLQTVIARADRQMYAEKGGHGRGRCGSVAGTVCQRPRAARSAGHSRAQAG